MVKKFKILISMSFAVMTVLLSNTAFAKEIWVSVGSNGDGSAQNPYGTIQKAADVAQPGDIVMIKPGVYYEQVDFKGAGTKDAPIIFRASEFGKNKVIITRADKDIREKVTKWTLEDEERNIYSVPFDEMPMRVLHNGANIMRLGKYEYLQELKYVGSVLTTSNPDTENPYTDIPTLKEGYYWDEESQKLFVRLRADEKYGDIDPNNNLMCVSPQAYEHLLDENGEKLACSFSDGISTDSYCFGVISEKPAYTVLYGLTFETPGFTGVFVRAHDVTVSNCWFEGCANAVKGGRRYNLDNFKSDRVTVEYSEWHAWPYAEDVYEMMAEGTCPQYTATWHGKNVAWSNNCYEVGSLVGTAGDDWVIRNNEVHDTLDALSFYAWEHSKEFINGRTKSIDVTGGEVYENRFYNLLDNAIEFESHAMGLDVHHNEMVNTYLPFSIQPLNGPPWPTNIKFHHNILYQSPERTALYTNNGVYRDSDKYDPKNNGDRAYLFKVGIDQRTNWSFPWSTDEMLSKTIARPAKTINHPDKGVQVYNNILYSPDTRFATIIGRMGGDRGEKSNMKFTNNIISCLVLSDDYYSGVSTAYNYQHGDLTGRTVPGTITWGWEYERNMFIPTNGQTMASDASALDGGGILAETYEKAGIPGLPEGKIELTSDSPAINKGVEIYGEASQTTTIGPLAEGETWHIDYSPYPYGDVNCDNVVDETDVFAIMQAQNTKLGDEEYKSRADLNFDGDIDEEDVQLALAQI